MALIARIREKQGRTKGPVEAGTTEEGEDTDRLKGRWSSIDEIKLDEHGTVGPGSLGVVVRGRWRGRPVAVRELWPELRVDEAQLSDFIKRVDALTHPRLLSLLSAVHTPRPALVLPLAHRSLYDLLYRDGLSLEPRQICQLAIELAEGLAFLHSKNTPHGRLHPNNILLDEGGHAMLADHAWCGPRQQITARRDASTPSPLLWASPEVLSGEDPALPSDIYSLSIVLWGAITRRVPYDAAALVPAVRIVGGSRPALQGVFSVWPRLFAQCWHAEPASRPTIKTVQLVIDEAMGEAHLPRYWTGVDYAKVDVTATLSASIQVLINAHTNGAWLGEGRDVREAELRGAYGGLQVVKVTRIENAHLWRTHVLKREALRRGRTHPPLEKPPRTQQWRPLESMPGLDMTLNEAWLFHGLRHEHVESIAKHGFDERYCSLGGLYGAACYFAEMACKADQYATRNNADEFALFLTRVPLGSAQVLTKRDSTAAGVPRRKPDESFDSVVAEAGVQGAAYLRRHREFCVYDGERCYAEYLVTFKRVATPPGAAVPAIALVSVVGDKIPSAPSSPVSTPTPPDTPPLAPAAATLTSNSSPVSSSPVPHASPPSAAGEATSVTTKLVVVAEH